MDATATPAPPTSMQKLLAEAIGTFVLVVLGVGAAIFTDGDIAAIGLAFGIAVVAMVYAFGRVSGGHFNPAVSVGAAVGGRISWREAGTYVGAQLGGAIVAGLVLAIIAVAGDYGYEFGDNLGANHYGDQGGIALLGALLIELVLTFIFLTTILAVTDERNEHPALAPLTIGLTLAAIHFASIGATGTSVNPARSIGVGLFSGGDAIIQLWLFILAPLLGGALAGLAYPAIFGHASAPVAGSGLNFGGGSAVPGAVPGYGAPDQFQQQWNQPGATPVGYAAPDPAQSSVPAAQAQPGYQQAAPAEQPIIQDGWQWDPATQQWIPAQQQPPVGGGWAAPGSGEQTQVRPPDGV